VFILTRIGVHINQNAHLSNNHETTPLLFTVWEYGDSESIQFQLDYSKAYFTDVEAQWIGFRILHCLQQLLLCKDIRIVDLSIIPAAEMAQIQHFSQGPCIESKDEATLTGLFQRQLLKTPNAIAISDQQVSWSYRELNARAMALAAALQAKGCSRGDSVGICITRTAEMVVAVLATLHCGAIYLPLDPSYPANRLSYLLNDSQAKLVVCDIDTRSLVTTLTDADWLFATDSNYSADLYTQVAVDAEDIAYFIYTSGSTGQPKGVEIRHRNAHALIEWAKHQFSQQELSAVLASTSLNFDLSVFEIFAPLAVGGEVVVVENALSLLDTPVSVSLINTVPSAIKALLEMGAVPDTAEVINLAGEPLPQQTVNDLLALDTVKKVYNLYGPSEDTTYSTYRCFEQKLVSAPTIGFPIANTQAWVVDKQGGLLPLGLPGELYLSGEGVAKQYRNRPELSAEKFIKSTPYSEQSLYKTGDLVRFDEHGELHFLGRLDHQVKVRGFRIELGEIEAQLAALPLIKQAVVMLHENLDATLCAYLAIADDSSVDQAELKRQLLCTLPEYMVPQYFVFVDAIPLNPNGKIDRKALLAHQPAVQHQADAAPLGSTEIVLAEMWQGLLNRKDIGRESDFFSMGGHSLLAVKLLGQIQLKFRITITLAELFEFTSLKAMAMLIRQARPTEPNGLVTVDASTPLELSKAQLGIWLDVNRTGTTARYNMPLVLEVPERLEIDVLEVALSRLMHQHQVLASRFVTDNGNVTQVYDPSLGVDLAVYDEVEEQQLQALIDISVCQPFDLTTDCLFRVRLLRTSERNYLVLVIHHIICDGWSVGILAKDLGALYMQELHDTHGQRAASPNIQFRDYLFAQTAQPAPDEQTEQYWRQMLADCPQMHGLPLDFDRSTTMSDIGQRACFTVSGVQYQNLRTISDKLKVSPANLLQTCFIVTLSRWSNSNDIMFGVPTLGRSEVVAQQLVGCFTELQVVRTQLDSQQSFADLAAQVQCYQRENLKYMSLSFHDLVERFASTRNVGTTPLIQILFNYQELAGLEFNVAGSRCKKIATQKINTRFEFELHVEHHDDLYQCELIYADQLFEKTTIQRFIESFCYLIDHLQQSIALPVGQIPLTTINIRNETKPFCSEYANLPTLLAKSFDTHADQVALDAADKVITYKELGDAVAKVAAQLIDLGVLPGDTVGICLTRESHLVIAVLAVLTAGANYTALDPEYPPARLAYIIEDSAIGHIITQSSLLDTLGQTGSVAVHNIIELLQATFNFAVSFPVFDANQLSHVIYTSGSTGQPKGVEISHNSVLALISWAKHYFSSAELRAVLASTSLNFDLSVFEIFVTLSVGGKIVLVNNALALTQQNYDVSLINTVPSAIKVLLEQGAIPTSVQAVNLAGEPLPMMVVNELLALPHTLAVYNLYGPSEDTTYSTAVRFTEPLLRQPTIGTVIDHTLGVVMSCAGMPQPAGAIGELYLAGAGLARQYRGKPELTAEKFVITAVLGDERFYRTGDLVRVDANNQLVYLGRTDHQIKLRGYRIELGEIEARIAELETVKDAAVLLSESSQGPELVAYLVSTVGNITPEALKSTLRGKLPTYMLPNHVIMLDSMPLTPNGKIDRKALPNFTLTTTASGELPYNGLEFDLEVLWQRLLNREQVYRKDNFFELGGHSLLVARFVHLAAQEYDLMIPAHWLYRYQDIASLAAAVEQIKPEPVEPPIVPTAIAPLSSAQYRIWFLERLKGFSTEFNISGAIKVEGVINYADIHRAMLVLVERHAMLRVKIDSAGDYPTQILEELPSLPLNLLDLQSHSDSEVFQRIAIKEHQQQVFDSGKAGMWSMLFVQTAPTQGLLHFNFHHAIADGWSISLLLSELMALLNKASPAVPTALWSYLDYAKWQQASLSAYPQSTNVDFWTEYLRGGNDGISLPFDVPTGQPEVTQPEVRVELGCALTNQLEAVAKQHDTQLFMVLYCAFGLLIARLSAEDDFNIGIPVTGRERAEEQNLFGNFLNNLPTRFQVNSVETLTQLIKRHAASIKQVLAHQTIPFEAIIDATEHHASGSAGQKTPLFQVFFNMLNLPEAQLSGASVTAQLQLDEYVDSKFDLTLYASKSADKTSLRFNFDAKKYDRKSIELFAQQYQAMLQQFSIDGLQTSVQQLVLSIERSNETRSLPSAFKTLPWQISVHDKIAQQAQRSPQQVAVEHLERRWSYQELDNVTAQLALLLQSHGVKGGDRVAIVTQRSDLLVFVTLATLKAGAAFVMLSAGWPAQRTWDILEAATPSLIVSVDQGGVNYLTELKVQDRIPCITIDPSMCQRMKTNDSRAEFVSVEPDSLAYVAFTSGTEGKPKGVLGRHRTLTTFSDWMNERFELSPRDRFGMLSGLVHDPLHRDMFTPLMMGATLCIPTDQQYQYDQLSQWLHQQQITVLHMTPSLGYLIASTTQTALPSLRRCFFVGEKLTKAHVSDFKQFAPNLSIINMYGSTETGRAIGYYQITKDQLASELPDVLPAGVGIAGTQLLVLKPDLTLCEIGEPGQIAVRSNALALGYLNDPDKTADKFVYLNATGRPEDRLYLTGDMGRYRLDGCVVCLGRTDRQIKIRGFRVELAEIEVAASQLEGVKQAVVLADASANDCRICLYVVPTGNLTQQHCQQLESQLTKLLPDYMLPHSITVVSSIPQTENGKIDSAALLKQTVEKSPPVIQTPNGELEEVVWQLFCDALLTNNVCAKTSFFAQGGNSLLMTQLLARLQRELRVSISYEDFFNDSSVVNVASLVGQQRALQNVFLSQQSPKNKKKVLI